MEDICFADFTLERRKRQLRHGADLVPIGARGFDLLEFLVIHHARIVTRDEIMAAVWPDSVVGDNNLNVQIANLRRILGAKAIMTVPRRGLRFALDIDPASTPLPLPDRPSVVVLPFSTFGGDPDLDWFADGFVEDITTELSRFHDLFVVARNSAFVYRQMPRDLRRIAGELGVRYVVEGSVRATAARVRVTVQLIDASSGGHVWAETFDRDMAEHFETQAIVAQRVVSCLTPQIERAEADRIRVLPPDDLTAHGLARQGWAAISSEEMSYDTGPRNRAAALARQALAADPRSGLAFRVLAWVAWWNVYHGTTDSVAATLAEGIDAASRAIAIDPDDHHARRLRAQLNFMKQDAETSLPELRLAHEINPNCALTLCWLGFYEAINGNAARGVPLAEAGLRRSPRDPARGSMLCALGFAHFASRNYAASAAAAEAALAEVAQGATPLILGTIAYVGTGQLDRATETFRKVERIAPGLVAARLSGRWLSSNADYLARADMFFRIAAGLAPPEAAVALR
ncbi:winged helix-turn-helix domain-containing tetratricopeptide repeat protein [Seohaeicola saemankumensis]|uniref:Winged helix-turn-helix domain-containing tetratricopeptide repeat protein n=1 Tax=Seohaeicola saemankumensis TaxID=481181 RepID=A0ABW3TDR1_9RHOB